MVQVDPNKSKSYVQKDFSYCQKCAKRVLNNELAEKMCRIEGRMILLLVCKRCRR